MPPKLKGSIRRSQLVTTYGVGAIVPVGDEALMVAAPERWDVSHPDLHEPRLERELRVTGFVQPPSSDDRPDVPVVRFPTWQSCPNCQRLARHREFTHFDLNTCPDCTYTLVPSRFVIACERGHIDDFPYDRWVHEGPRPDGGHRLEISSTGATASLRGIVISCSCGASRTMEHAFDRMALANVSTCQGRRPWKTFDGEPCDRMPRTLQRGASSVWFAHTRSALSIPPWSESASRALDGHWPTLRYVPVEAVGTIVEQMGLPAKTGFTKEELLAIFAARKQEEQGEATGEVSLRREEYEALSRGRVETTKDVDFATRPGTVPTTLTPWIEQLQIVTRLREVRALAGFSRIKPPQPGPGGNVVSLADETLGWLPAMEVKGEGLFLRLSEARLSTWATSERVQARAVRIADEARRRHDEWGTTLQRDVSPSFLLLHVLAHALINQLSLDVGYPAGSLRERLYVEDGARGVLVYTATSDSAGSLGGLISQGNPDRFEGLVRDGVERFAWCSADPVCIESDVRGSDALNLAACHSCALLPETSCDEMNRYLDRALLVGTPSEPEIGFFHGI
ncbi:MAG TPA: DUF1998 domain-containing protein [Baekduia sp.]|uniref:DUF1998 domain-containing protein n=1 Tax=Baekduia sp. TaxID=2600305 RepID=UPI002CE8DD84|nr:DUF1998 domain-containing protein [Baekduia sp.]HMJ34970.1 DUF1998 domain-containing protein [Baekduia sp.]